MKTLIAIIVLLVASLPAFGLDAAVFTPVGSAWTSEEASGSSVGKATVGHVGVRALGGALIFDGGPLLGVETGQSYLDFVAGYLPKPKPISVGPIVRYGRYNRHYSDRSDGFQGYAYGGGLAVNVRLNKRVKFFSTLEYARHPNRPDGYGHGAVLRLGATFGTR